MTLNAGKHGRVNKEGIKLYFMRCGEGGMWKRKGKEPVNKKGDTIVGRWTVKLSYVSLVIIKDINVYKYP